MSIRQQIKKESYDWYIRLRESKYEYLHEFKERINEILWFQQKHHEIINSDIEPTPIKQASMNELHRLNITPANYFEVAPAIINGITPSRTPEIKNKAVSTESETESSITI